MRWRQLCALGAAALLIGGAAAPDKSSSRGVPVVRGEVIRDFARVTFEWPQSTYLDAETKGKTLSLSFDRKANPDFRKLLSALSPYISKAETAKDGKTVRLFMDKPYRVRSFVSGNVNGVDILDIDPQAHKAHAAAKLSPAAGEEKPAEKPAVKAEEKPAPAVKEAPKETPKEAAKEPTKETLKEAAKPAEKSAAVKVFASQTDDRTVLRFAWGERVAAGVFIRNGLLWIVFNKPAELDMEAVKETASTLYPSIVPLASKDATILRLPTPAFSGVAVSKGADKLEWDVVLTGSPQAPSHAVPVEVDTEPPLLPHVFLAVEEIAPTLTIEDPDVGDTLLIAPAYAPGVGISPRRGFVEFVLLESAQGIVVQKIADGVQVTPVRNGLRVGTEKGAQLSTHIALATQKAPEITLPGGSKPLADIPAVLFPYEAWKADPHPNLREQILPLEQTASATRDQDTASALHLRMAQMYLAAGLDVEALAQTQEIRRTNPQYYIANRVSALAGGAEFLLHRFGDAAEDFSTSELQGSPEVAYWQSMLAELLGKPDQTYDYLANNDAIIRNYPPRMRQQLAIVAADRAVAHADYNVALQIIETLKEDNLVTGVEDYVAYLLAKTALETGKEQEGIEALTKLAQEQDHDLPVRARAEFTLIDRLVKQRAKTPAEPHAKPTPEDAALIARLEKLYNIWRGDNLEMQTLKILGEMYAEYEEYPQAMRVWRDLITDFPSTVAAAEALERMRTTFITLFDGTSVTSLPLLDQLSLYYEFRSLTPADETGDRIVITISDRLVAMDLLEQAITLVDYRMRYLYEKEARSRAGARLANIYLLNHQPDKALIALQRSVYGQNPPDLRQNRDRLAAKAMVEMGRYAEAEKLIAADKTPEAETIRQRAWWKQKQWPKFIASLEDQIKQRHDPAAPVTDQEAEQLVRLAIAYGAENETTQLQYLRDYFTPLISGSPRAKLFDYLTEQDVPATPETYEALMQQVEHTQDFLHADKIRPDLPEPPAPPAPPADEEASPPPKAEAPADAKK